MSKLPRPEVVSVESQRENEVRANEEESDHNEEVPKTEEDSGESELSDEHQGIG